MRTFAQRFSLGREIEAARPFRAFEARDEASGSPVVIRILPDAPGGQDAARFRRGALDAAGLAHSNVARVYDVGEDRFDGHPVSYAVTESPPGGTLRDLLAERGRLPEGELSKMGAAVAAGLAHAHERGVTHGGLGLEDVLLDGSGNPKLANFGAGRFFGSSSPSPRTALYAAPERLNGGPATPAGDAYSLGAVLYHAAVGEPPFPGGPDEVADGQLNSRPVPPGKRGVEIGPGFEGLVLACLENDPARRPAVPKLYERLLAVHGAGPHAAAGSAPSGGSSGGGRPAVLRRVSGGAANVPALAAGLAAVVLLLALGVYVAGLVSDAGSPASSLTTIEEVQGSGAPEPAEEPPEEPPPEEPPPEETAEPTQPPPPEEPPPPADVAAQTVFDMYAAAAEDRFEDSWDYLSRRQQEEVGSVAAWQERYQTLSFIYFNQFPVVQEASGDEARIYFEAQETRPQGEVQTSGVWVVVAEDGEWKLDRLIENQF